MIHLARWYLSLHHAFLILKYLVILLLKANNLALYFIIHAFLLKLCCFQMLSGIQGLFHGWHSFCRFHKKSFSFRKIEKHKFFASSIIKQKKSFRSLFQVLSKFFFSPFFLCISCWFWPKKVAWDLIPSATLFCGYFSFPTSILAYIQLVLTISRLVLLVVTLFGGWSHLLFVIEWFLPLLLGWIWPPSTLLCAFFFLFTLLRCPVFAFFMTTIFLFVHCPVFTIFAALRLFSSLP